VTYAEVLVRFDALLADLPPVPRSPADPEGLHLLNAADTFRAKLAEAARMEQLLTKVRR
jgi:hypothetical protein